MASSALGAPILGTGIIVPATAGIDITTLGTLKGWWDANDLSTLWQDSGRTTPVTANNDPVGAWDDKSGNGIHVTQSVAGSRPLYKTGVQNSKSGITFDGTDDALFKSTVASSGANATMFCVVKATANTGKFFQNGEGSGYHLNQHVANRDFLAENVSNQDDGAMSHAAFEIWVGTVASGTPLWTLRVNGAGQTLTPNNTAPIAPATKTTLGGAAANFLTGTICECGIYDSVLSGANITTLETYLNTKYAVF